MKLTSDLFKDPLAVTIYGERFLNDSKGRFEDYSEVDVRYDPQGDTSHIDLSYCILPPERCTVMQSLPSSDLLSWLRLDGGYKFFWHPDVTRRELVEHGRVRVQPTSSTRTLLTEAKPRVYIKTDLDKKHFRFVRRLRRSSVQHSVAICNDLRQFTANLPQDSRYSFLPESLGIVVNGGEHEGSGVIFREVIPYPETGEKRLILPYHALYANDPFSPEDEPLLVQMVRIHANNDNLSYFVGEIVGPLLEAWVLLVSQRGLLPELHGQNALAEIDEQLKLRRVVHRDFQGTYSDSFIRSDLGLPLFAKHVVGTEAGTTIESQYSHVFDGMIGRFLVSRLVKVFRTHFGGELNIIHGAIRRYHQGLRGYELAKFPETTYRFANHAQEQVGNEVSLAATGEKPEFR